VIEGKSREKETYTFSILQRFNRLLRTVFPLTNTTFIPKGASLEPFEAGERYLIGSPNGVVE